MKNLLTYTDISKKFVKFLEPLTKIQIENSLYLEWQAKDIILATNFEWEYKGIKSVLIGEYETFDNNRSTKIPIIIELFKKGIIEEDVYWFHDHDAFQIVPFEYQLPDGKDAAFTTHGAYNPKLWNAGSFFFNNKAQDIFEDIFYWMNKRGTNEQNALTYMWEINWNNINKRCEIIDPSYNLGIYKIPQNLKLAKGQIKVAHFHPEKKHHLDLFRDMLPPHLITIFKNYGFN